MVFILDFCFYQIGKMSVLGDYLSGLRCYILCSNPTGYSAKGTQPCYKVSSDFWFNRDKTHWVSEAAPMAVVQNRPCGSQSKPEKGCFLDITLDKKVGWT